MGAKVKTKIAFHGCFLFKIPAERGSTTDNNPQKVNTSSNKIESMVRFINDFLIILWCIVHVYTDCLTSVFGCCPDNKTPAGGYNYRGCPGELASNRFT